MTDLSGMSDQELLAMYKQQKEMSQWGPGARRLPNGAIVRDGPRGGLQVLQSAPKNATASGKSLASPEQRTRLRLALAPAVEAQKQLYQSENWEQRQPRNPFNQPRNALARVAEAVPFDDGAAARVVGGNDYQQYEQALRTFESSFLPVFSGAAVTPTEAKRFIRANLPQMGDTPSTLAKKATNRAMMINAAAELIGEEKPFPRVGTWKGGQPAARPAPQAQAKPQGRPEPKGRMSDDEIRKALGL